MQIRQPAAPNPMVDNAAIVDAIYDRHIKMKDVADQIGICYHSLRRRLDTGSWSVLEAWRICQVLQIPFDTVFLAYPDKLPKVIPVNQFDYNL